MLARMIQLLQGRAVQMVIEGVQAHAGQAGCHAAVCYNTCTAVVALMLLACASQSRVEGVQDGRS